MPSARSRLLVGLIAVVALLAGAVCADASTTQISIIQDDALLQSDPVGTLAQMQALGATQVRYPVRWYEIAPAPQSPRAPKGFAATNPSAYPARNWTALDTIVTQAHADGLSMDLLVTGPAPRWAERDGEPRGGPFGVWKPNAADFGAFVRALATRFSGHYTPAGASAPLPRVSFWGIWNEPNFGIDLAPQATDDDAVEISPSYYRALLDRAWGALMATGHRHDTILIGETAPHGHPHPIGDFDLIAPIRFIKRLYCLDDDFHILTGLAAVQRSCPSTPAEIRRFRAANPALFDASGFAIHPYAAGVPPDESQPGSVQNAADLAAIPNVERTLNAVFRAYGSRRRIPLYNTEYGYQVGGKVTLQDEATYINWAEYLSYKNPRVRSYAQYLLDDPTNNKFETGLFDALARPKPALAAYRMPLFMPRTRTNGPRSLEVWGGVRAAYLAFVSGEQPQAEIQFRPAGSQTFRTISVVKIHNVRGYFDVHLPFSESGTLRTTWTDSLGEVDHSRSVRVTVG